VNARIAAAVFLSGACLAAAGDSDPFARIVPASKIVIPGEIDSNTPVVWDTVDGARLLFAVTSWGGVPVRSAGRTLDSLQPGAPVEFSSHPGHGVWMESIVKDDAGTWYGFFHQERNADLCGRSDRQLPRIGALRSADRGRTWDDLGFVIDAPPGTEACDSDNRFVLGGVGDVSVMLDAESKDLYLFFSQYSRDPAGQGVAVARLAWADRDAPAGKVTVWNNGAWLPASGSEEQGWTYPAGTPLVKAGRPFHDGSAENDVFWGAAVHWNTYLEQYVMLLNRARDDQFGQEGIYVSYATTLADPRRWSAPKKILEGGTWYPQVIGLETNGTDRLAGQRARFFMMGKSEGILEFER
jgi:hypothetical protein